MSIGHGQSGAASERVSELVSGNAVVVFTVRGCCICHAVKQLLFGLGVGPAIVELANDTSDKDINAAIFRTIRGGTDNCNRFPVVFVGGKFLGGIEAVLAHHIRGALVPLLKDAGALWL
ncbi:glutaredoxin-C9-like [Primulina tabacum]|uniref:glutaredoxin-C9-like n=1 Tax=Primulina tabacum TaxID=48773 RepID=UPI003F599CEF